MDNSNSMMDILSDSECSDTSDSQLNSSASSSSSDSETSSQSLEPARILKQNLDLPKGLCENQAIFEEFFSLETWNCLPDHMKDQLKPFMPRFTSATTSPQEEQHQQMLTIQKLFTNQITRFDSSPLIDFRTNLEEGNYRADISRLRANIRKSQRREQRFQHCERISRLAKSLAVSREKLLRAAYSSPPGAYLHIDKMFNQTPKLSSPAAALRAKKRYFQEIASITEDIGMDGPLSEDENYPEGPPVQLSRKQRKNLIGMQGASGIPGVEPKIQSTTTHRGSSIDSHLIGLGGAGTLSDDYYGQLLNQHRKRKHEEPDHPELDTADIKIRDVNARIQQSTGRRVGHPGRPPNHSKKLSGQPRIKSEPDLNLSSESNSLMLLDGSLPSFNEETAGPNSADAQEFKIPQDDSHLKKSPSVTSLNSASKPVTFNNLHNSFSDSEQETEIKFEIKKEIKIEETEPLIPPLLFDSPKPMSALPTQSQVPEVRLKKPRLNSISQKVATENSAHIISAPIATINNADDFLVDIKTEKVEPSSSTQYQNVIEPEPPALLTSSPTIKVEKSIPEKTLNFVNVANYSGKPMQAATLSDLEGIDMMHLPVDLDDSGHIDMLNEIVVSKQELMQETHACFLSLVRDIFCSTPDHRTTSDNLRAKISAWVANPITALNDWFSQADSWLDLLPSAVHFLAGEFLNQPDEFVPYLEYKSGLKIYQWIGAGRDSDQHLKPLCEYWLRRRNEMGTKPPPKHQTESITQTKIKHNTSTVELEESFSNNGSAVERLASPPPPRCPTTWMVNKASPDEISEFREQERRRFENPHLSFTYRMHGYESVVGPVKGIYTQIPALTKARGHNMLTQDRPNFVTILTLVRDATARLPNGEGTRADICELLKSSQYISPSAAESVFQTIVSGALDRMHTEHDPCVRYDPKRKIWIYLHRGRTEEEFERMHQQFQGVSKHKKQNSRKMKTKSATCKSPTPKKMEPSIEISTDVLTTASTVPPPPPSAIAAPKKKVIVNPVPSQVTVPISTIASPPNAVVKIQSISCLSPVQLASPNQMQQQPVVISAAPQMPALSSIQNPGVMHSGNIPPLINKIGTVQKKVFVKQELVPIVLDNMEPIDVEASLDVHTTPIPVKKIAKQQIIKQIQQPSMPSLIVDKGHKFINKNIVKPIVGIVASAATTPIKVSTSSGIQTVHVSTAHQSLAKPNIATILTAANNQSMLVSAAQNRTQSPTRKLIQKAPPPLVAQSTPTTHSFVTIPISIGKASQQIKQIQAIIPQTTMATASKLQKATIPALTSTVVPRMSLLQTQQPTTAIIRGTVPAGKSLINPTVANNLAIQQQIQPQQVTTVVPTSTVQVIQAKSLQHQKIIVASVASPTSTTKTYVAATSTSNPMVVQKIISMSKATSSSPQQHLTFHRFASPATDTTRTEKRIDEIAGTEEDSQLQTALVTTSATSGTPVTITPAGTSLINPQIIQIHQPANQRTHQLAAGAKVQTLSANNLTPLQQQNLLNSIKQQQIRVQSQQSTATPQQQTLIIKQQQVLQQIQKQLQQHQLNSPNKHGTSPLGTQIQLSPSVSGGQVTSMIVTGPTITSTATQSQPQQTITRTIKAIPRQHVPHRTAVNLSGGSIRRTLPLTTSNVLGAGDSASDFRCNTIPSLVLHQKCDPLRFSATPDDALIANPGMDESRAQAGQVAQIATTGSPNATVRTVSGTSPLVGKVLTNPVGQIISLPNVQSVMAWAKCTSGKQILPPVHDQSLQKQTATSGPTLRLAGAKPGQTASLIQLAGAPGSQITQYAVVSQGRNLFSMAQPRQSLVSVINTTTVNSSGIVTTAGIRPTGVSVLATTNPTTVKPIAEMSKTTPGQLTPVTRKFTLGATLQQGTSQPRVIQSAQLQPISAQALVNAKVLGNLQAVSSKPGMMLNASNLNIAHIGGKQVIIASKAPGIMQQQSQQQQTSGRQNLIWTQGANNSFVIGGQTVKVQGNVLTTAAQYDASATAGTLQTQQQQQTVMFGNQIVKLQTHQPVSIRSPIQGQTATVLTGIASTASTTTTPTRTVVLGSTGQTIKAVSSTQGGVSLGKMTMTSPQQQVVIGGAALKNVIKGTTMNAGPGQRVVLVQGGGQILLPPNFQGGSINLKSLQGLKMIPIQQQQTTQVVQQATAQLVAAEPQTTRVTNQGIAES